MKKLLVSILPQPDDATCGPTCLHAVYAFHGDHVELDDLVKEVVQLEEGGTLAVHVAHHALRRGYSATIHTYNLQVFDPTWFGLPRERFRERLALQYDAREDPKLRSATAAYLEFLDLGGHLRLDDLTPALIRRYLKRGTPVLTGLSSTFLYRNERERPDDCEPDDIRGQPVGHFVVLCGYDPARRSVLVADPLMDNPISDTQVYEVGIERVLASILLGMITYDANLLVIEPPRYRRSGASA